MSKPSKREFKKFRNPRFGKSNPHDLTNPYWIWCVKNRESGYCSNEAFNGPSSFDAGPAWCCDRFGQTETILPDGRRVLIAGEHEDSYDPDFNIYNDVIVIDSNDQVTIYGYPEDIFPPTDFHTATLVDNEIILIGSLGYPDQRKDGETQVLRLNLNDWSITPQKTTNPPGWISHHQAEHCLESNTIRVSSFKRWTKTQDLVDEFSTWELSLDSWQWECTETKNWTQYQLHREDEESNNLWDIRHSIEMKELGISTKNQDSFLGDLDEEDAEFFREMEKEKQALLNGINPELIPQLYRPSLPHSEIKPQEPTPEELDDDDYVWNYNHFRICVDGVEICFIEESYEVTMRIEGQLAEDKAEQILKEVCQKLGEIEGHPYRSRKLS